VNETVPAWEMTVNWPLGKETLTGGMAYREVKQDKLQHICSLAPESMSQWVWWEELEGIRVEEVWVEAMEEEIKGDVVIWFEVRLNEEDAGATKFACWSKDTSWEYCSEDKPVEVLEEVTMLSSEETTLESTWETTLERAWCCLITLGYPCFW